MRIGDKARHKEMESNLVCRNGVHESGATCLFLTLDKEYQVDAKSPLPQQFGGGACHCHDRTLIICDAPTIEVAISASDGEWVRVPAVARSRDDVVMSEETENRYRKQVVRLCLPIEQYARLRVFALCSVEGRQNQWTPVLTRGQLLMVRPRSLVVVYKQSLTSVESAPSWCRHFFNQMAAWRQSSRCEGSELILGIETKIDSA